MGGFAISFYSLFSGCTSRDPDAPQELVFDTFHGSLLIMFDAMLGNVDLMSFQSDVVCSNPERMGDLGLLLLASYMVIMAIILLNLLIAILSTVHSDVNQNIEQEYQLARTNTIYKTAKNVIQVGKLPVDTERHY